MKVGDVFFLLTFPFLLLFFMFFSSTLSRVVKQKGASDILGEMDIYRNSS